MRISLAKPPLLPSLGLAMMTLGCHTARAEDGFHGLLGAGIAYAPTYDGAKERRTQFMLLPDLRYRAGAFEASTTGGLRYWAIDKEDLQLALVLGADGGRAEKRTRGGLGAEGSDRLKGMGKLSATAELGLAGSWQGLGLPLSFSVMRALGSKGHGGLHGSVEASWPFYNRDKLQLAAELGLGWGDKRYNQAYYGVTAEQAARTAFRAYAPGAGLHGLDLRLNGQYQLSERWSLMGSVGYHRLLGDAAKSPLTERKATPMAMLGLGYRF